MPEKQKSILLEMMTSHLFHSAKIPRGSGKSLVYFLELYRAQAVRRTNYILAAIDEKL